ncbi:MAG: signal recognition particle-docking protein FtsY [Clostridia bacterium]|nr:signal recognition particle-docking protein FtsY [Clostridia bacterium]
MSFFEKLKAGMSKTRKNISEKINVVLSAFTRVDEDLLEELEETLILCDLGVSTSTAAIEKLRSRIKLERIKDVSEVKKALKEILLELVDFEEKEEHFPKIILIVGVNGAGKTTSIGKIAHVYKEQGKDVMLAAADTFRAAASEQLTIWADRAGVPIVKYGEGHDPAAVVYDAIDSCKSHGRDLIIVDTAGRLHNKVNLMNELGKISRVIDREYPEAEKETLLVLDGTAGQNALFQAREFANTVHVDGIILTKLDGTAKGGFVLAIKEELGIPVKYIGVGEGIDDLQRFDPKDFVDSLID